MTDLVDPNRHEYTYPEERGMPEQQIAVVFDVSSDNREEAANLVANVIGMNSDLCPVGTNNIESWWFPESDIKHVDGNDNGAFALVPLDFLQLLSDAIDQGDAEGLDMYHQVLSNILTDGQ